MKKIGNYIIESTGKIYSYNINDYLKPDITKDGYAQVTLSIDGELKRDKVHRFVAESFIDNPLNKPTVNHIDGNKLNNNVDNLEWATYYENNKHARDNHLNPVSENNKKRWTDNDFREKTSKAISKGRVDSGCAKGKLNPQYKYLIIHNGEEITKEQLQEITGFAISTINRKIRDFTNGKKCEVFLKSDVYVINTKKDVQTNERVG